VLAAGGWIYLRSSRPKSRFARIGATAFAIFLVAMTVATPFQPDPKSPAAFSVSALSAYLGISVIAALVDRGREMTIGTPSPGTPSPGGPGKRVGGAARRYFP